MNCESLLKAKFLKLGQLTIKLEINAGDYAWKVKANTSQMCWLAMPLGVGILRWVLSNHTIGKINRLVCKHETADVPKLMIYIP